MSSQLPAAVQAAHTPPERRARVELNLDRIVAAAIEIADRDGLAGISMARVAKHLGFATMSLYRHVGSKDELLTHLQDAALSPLPQIDTGQGWRAGLAQWTHEWIAAYRRHPWVLDIPITTPPLMPNSLHWTDIGLSLLTDLPLMAFERLMTLSLLSDYARSQVSLQENIVRDESVPVNREHLFYEAALRDLADRERFPALHELLATGSIFEMPGHPDEGDRFMLEYGLERILDGIEVLVNRRRDTA
ncbi:TetR/AcrR family transcriptional regulator [Stackebrandtia endophytica]|uniref:TetR/AcrR family transcriptional regulator n=1 Tax=Stackebrandtia endophytica TaxID=1496996 RepID=UPI001476CAD1|nr:TetR/AcrR family transcriptional regulator [Stackebrandtia endophytica]